MDTIKKENPWMIHLKSVKEKNKNLKLSEVMQLAKQTYKKIDPVETSNISDEISYEEFETQNLKQASEENNPLKSEQESTPVLITKQNTPFSKQEDLQLNNEPPAIITKHNSEEIKKVKIENWLGGGRKVITAQEQKEYDKLKLKVTFWEMFAVILIILAVILTAFVYQGKFQTNVDTQFNPNFTLISNSSSISTSISSSNCSEVRLNCSNICNPEIKIYINST